ncbi:MAG: Nif3-like dinuclear metal center hexameric protein [Treponema sp.]|jgi:dinuclear metal center YbgI/SA1388 family protein|nr:Nif3-like dinuclear metal center hexameric protein [Treponema sp.]
MNSATLDSFFRSLLHIEDFSSIDPSLNGLQVDNDGAQIDKLAFAVDVSLETIARAASAKAGLLFVHHGLFWGTPLRITGNLRSRIKALMDNNLALYAVHLPLDQHPQLGNNAVLAKLLGIVDPEPFGAYHGRKIGYKGKLQNPLSIDEAVKRIAFMGKPPLGVYAFGKEKSETCAVVSGGAAEQARDALEEGIDLYVTGETSHSVYNDALEGQLNMIAGGHYATEVWGVRAIMERAANLSGLNVEFIDVPTGL